VTAVTEGQLNSDSYTPAEAALILGVTPTRVRQLLQEGEFEGERDEAGHWSIPARAVRDRLERLRRERFVEAVGADPLSVRALQERVEVLQRELGRLEGRLEAWERAYSSLESERTLLAKRLEGEQARAEQLQAELGEERSKGLWRRLFGGG
jgi:predicted  nucleic acid-binding Zn-ribbon protein